MPELFDCITINNQKGKKEERNKGRNVKKRKGKRKGRKGRENREEKLKNEHTYKINFTYSFNFVTPWLPGNQSSMFSTTENVKNFTILKCCKYIWLILKSHFLPELYMCWECPDTTNWRPQVLLVRPFKNNSPCYYRLISTGDKQQSPAEKQCGVDGQLYLLDNQGSHYHFTMNLIQIQQNYKFQHTNGLGDIIKKHIC